jgi:hypothetical protein
MICSDAAAILRRMRGHSIRIPYSPILKYVEGVNVENLVAAQTWLTAEWMT